MAIRHLSPLLRSRSRQSGQPISTFGFSDAFFKATPTFQRRFFQAFFKAMPLFSVRHYSYEVIRYSQNITSQKNLFSKRKEINRNSTTHKKIYQPTTNSHMPNDQSRRQREMLTPDVLFLLLLRMHKLNRFKISISAYAPNDSRH